MAVGGDVEVAGVSWLGMAVLLSPFLLTFLLFLVLFYPRKLSFSECLFTSIPTSQSFAAVFIFFVAGFSYGYVDVWLLRAFVASCSLLSLYLFLRAGTLEKLSDAFRSAGEEKGKKAKCVLISLLSLLLILALYHLYLHHTLSPNYNADSEVPDAFSVVEDRIPKRKIHGYRTRGASWSDLPMHLAVINSFRIGINSEQFTPLETKSVLFSGTEMAMPILADFHSAVLCIAGFDLRTSIVVPSTLLTSSLMVLLFLFSFRFSSEGKKSIVPCLIWGFVSLLLVIFSGGSGILSFVGSLWKLYREHEDIWKEGWKLLGSVDYVQNYGQGGRELYWFSLIHHVLIPQRGPAYSYPLFVSVLLFLWRSIEFSERPPSKPTELVQWRRDVKLLFAFSGIIGGLSPLMLSSTYLVICLFGGILFLFDLKKWIKDVFYLFHWIGFFVPLFVIGYFQVTTTLIRPSSFQNWGSLDFNPIIFSFGESIDKHSVLDIVKKFVQMWFDGLGLFTPLFLYSLPYVYYNPLRLRFYTGAFVIFAFANIFQINVWVRDNIRIFYCWHFIASACVSYSFCRIVSRSWEADPSVVIDNVIPDEKNESTLDARKQEERDENIFVYLKWIVVFLLVLLLIATGILPTVREPELNYDLYSADDVACGHWIAQNTAKNDVFLTSDAHIHPAFSLAGRPVALTFAGWLWSQGFEYKERQEKVDEALLCRSAPTTIETLKELKIKYLVLDEKFNTTLRNKIDETIQNESKQDDDDDDDDDDEDEDIVSSPIPPKEMLSCLESDMVKVYENAKYQIYLLSLGDSVSSVSQDGDNDAVDESSPSPIPQLIKPLQDEDEDEDEDRDDDGDGDDGGEEVVAPSNDVDYKSSNDIHGIHSNDVIDVPVSDNAIL